MNRAAIIDGVPSGIKVGDYPSYCTLYDDNDDHALYLGSQRTTKLRPMTLLAELLVSLPARSSIALLRFKISPAERRGGPLSDMTVIQNEMHVRNAMSVSEANQAYVSNPARQPELAMVEQVIID